MTVDVEELWKTRGGRPVGRETAIDLIEQGWVLVRVAGRFGGQDVSDPVSGKSFNVRIDTYCKLTRDRRLERFVPEGGDSFGVTRHRWKGVQP